MQKYEILPPPQYIFNDYCPSSKFAGRKCPDSQVPPCLRRGSPRSGAMFRTCTKPHSSMRRFCCRSTGQRAAWPSGLHGPLQFFWSNNADRHSYFYYFRASNQNGMGNDKGWIIIANPKSCGKRGLRHWPRLSNLLNYYDVVFTCVFTSHRCHAVELAVKAIRSGYRKIAVFGGLGTFHEAVNAAFIQDSVPVSEITFAFIPVLRSGYKGPKCPACLKPLHLNFNTYDQAAQALRNEDTEIRHIASVEYTETKVRHETKMVLEAGICYEAKRGRKFNDLQDSGQGGIFSGMIANISAFLSCRANPYTITVDGNEIFKGRLQTGKIGLSPADGKPCLHLKIVRKTNILKRLLLARDTFTGKIYDTGNTKTFSGSTIEMLAPENRTARLSAAISIDGETSGFCPVTIKTCPEPINLISYSGGPASRCSDPTMPIAK